MSDTSKDTIEMDRATFESLEMHLHNLSLQVFAISKDWILSEQLGWEFWVMEHLLERVRRESDRAKNKTAEVKE